MFAFLDDLAAVHDDDPVGRTDSGEAVGDDDCRAALHQMLERALDRSFAFGVERTGRFVEQEERGVAAEQGAGDGEALTLATGEARTAFAHEGVEPVWQLAKEGLGIGIARGGPDLVLRRVPIAVAQIVAGGRGEDHHFLRDHRNPLADVGRVGVLEVDAIERDAAFLRIVETLGELEDGGLARARRADQGELFVGADPEREIVQRGYFEPGRIAEADMLERQFAA